MDAEGNLYIANQPGSNGSTMIQSYTPDGTLRWERECHVGIEAPALHPENDNLVYSSDAKMRMDWSASEGQGWEATAVTVNPHRFPNDPRISGDHGASGGTYLCTLGNGQLYQYQTDMNSGTIFIFRFTDSPDQISPERNNLMLLNGFTKEHPDVNHHWKRSGKVIHRYDHWQPGLWDLRWSLVVPSEDTSGGNFGDGNVQAMDVAGDYLFLARNGSSKTLQVERGHVDVRRLDSGQYVG